MEITPIDAVADGAWLMDSVATGPIIPVDAIVDAAWLMEAVSNRYASVQSLIGASSNVWVVDVVVSELSKARLVAIIDDSVAVLTRNR